LGRVIMNRVLSAWLSEALLADSLSTEIAWHLLASAPRSWFFDGQEHVDPAKEANAQAKKLANNSTTLAWEYARQGRDWETELRQRAKEKQLMRELGLTEDESGPEPPTNHTQTPKEEDEDAQQHPAA